LLSHPLHGVLLEIPQAFQDEIVCPAGMKLFFDGTYNKNFTATVTARIAGLPIKAKTKKEQQILDQLNIGDEVCISYLVIFDLNYASDGERFMETTEGSEYLRTWSNGKGDKLEVIALPPVFSSDPTWVGVLKNNKNDLIDGTQGTQSQVERWLSQFQLGKTDQYTFNNLFSFNGKEYWRCDLSHIYAKKQKGHVVSVGEKVICLPIEEEIPDFIKGQLNHITNDTKIRFKDRARVVSSGINKKFKKDEIVAFNSNFLERYEFFGKEYYIIGDHLVHGKYVKA
jgi:hypothetical protein